MAWQDQKNRGFFEGESLYILQPRNQMSINNVDQLIFTSLARFLRYSIDESKIRAQDSVTVVSYVAGNSVGRELAWKFLKEKWNVFHLR